MSADGTSASQPDLHSVRAFGGLDLAATRDLTAFALVWPIEDLIYCHSWFWIPSEGLQERVRQDNVRYDLWAKDGHIELTPGPVTDWRYVTERIKQIADKYSIAEIAFDRYGARDTVGDLMDAGLTPVEFAQGPLSFNAPCRRLEELVLSRRIVHNGNPVLRWNIDCCTVKADANANIRPVKPDHLKSSKRIDGVVALVMALGRAMQQQDATPAVWSLG
jgi:phage terminase large subunit-like protein